MAVKWTCICGISFYSANPEPDKKTVKCTVCNKRNKNPYYNPAFKKAQ